MQPNLVLIILKYLEKRCQTYIWEMFCLHGLKIQNLRGIIEFLEKKLNWEQNRFLCDFYFVQCFEKPFIYTTRGLGLGLEEKSITSCPH